MQFEKVKTATQRVKPMKLGTKKDEEKYYTDNAGYIVRVKKKTVANFHTKNEKKYT